MAKVKAPLMSESASGTIGGLTFKQNGMGNIVGRRSITPALMTPVQLKQRAIFARVQHLWDNLDQKEKDAWGMMAVYPETARNRFIANTTRWLMLGIAGRPNPVPYQERDVITDVVISPWTKAPPTIEFAYSYDGNFDSIGIFYTLATFSHRESPKPRKLIYSGFAYLAGGAEIIPIKCVAPVVHVRLEIMNPSNGNIHQKLLYRADLTWP